ncbi:MAG: SRPBCC family protein [Rubrobacter sp.]
MRTEVRGVVEMQTEGPSAQESGAVVRIAESVVIERPVAEVFAFAGAYENDPRWRAGVVEMRQDHRGSPRVGTTTHEVMRLFGQRQVTVAKVVEYEPNERTAFESVEGPMPVRGYRAFEASGEGTRFTYEFSAVPTPLYRLLSPILAPILRRQVSGDLKRLKALLEGG